MSKKNILFLILFLIISGCSLIIINFYKEKKIVLMTLSQLTTYQEKLALLLENYKIDKTGVIDLKVNYKGAHGENYPANLQYHYELTPDTLYLENNTYSAFELDEKLLKTIFIMTNLKDFDISNYKQLTKSRDSIILEYESDYINQLFATSFSQVKLEIKTKGLIKKVSNVLFTLDDISICLSDANIIIKVGDNTVTLKETDLGFNLNINDSLKVSISLKESYPCTIALNDQVYYVEKTNDYLKVQFNTAKAIYNSIELQLKYQDLKLEKKREENDYLSNPLVRYWQDCNLSFWRF